MTTSVERVNGTPVTSAEPRFDPLTLAEAEAIRKRGDAEAEALRIEARGRAEAEKTKAVEESEKQRILNARAAMKLEREQAEHAAKMAEVQRKKEETERATRQAREQEAAQRQAQEKANEQLEQAEGKWRSYALGFYIVCAIVALPVQIAAFWSPRAPWLVVAPLMLEGGAWVVLKGAAAAVASHRPHWHYRLIAWALAFIAAGINLWHGLHAFDPATAIGTAFASVAGPGVWDLHEHGRIRTRDGKLTRRERKSQKRAEKRAADQRAAAEKRAKAEKEAAAEAEAERVQKLAQDRAEHFPKIWKHAQKLAAAVGETTITEAVWKRACRDIEGSDPGEFADILRGRNAAEKRVALARENSSVNSLSKTTNAQRASQMPNAKKPRVYNPPARRGVRRPGDTEKYVNAARKQAAITAKNAARRTTVEEQS